MFYYCSSCYLLICVLLVNCPSRTWSWVLIHFAVITSGASCAPTIGLLLSNQWKVLLDIWMLELCSVYKSKQHQNQPCSELSNRKFHSRGCIKRLTISCLIFIHSDIDICISISSRAKLVKEDVDLGVPMWIWLYIDNCLRRIWLGNDKN